MKFLCTATLTSVFPGHFSHKKLLLRAKWQKHPGWSHSICQCCFQRTTIGATTDFWRKFLYPYCYESWFRYVILYRLHLQNKVIKRGIKQAVNFQLDRSRHQLTRGRGKGRRKSSFSPSSESCWQQKQKWQALPHWIVYDTYSKDGLDLDHITEKFRQRKVMKKIAQSTW